MDILKKCTECPAHSWHWEHDNCSRCIIGITVRRGRGATGSQTGWCWNPGLDTHYLMAPQMLREAGLLNCDWGSACNAVVRFRESVWQVPRLEQRGWLTLRSCYCLFFSSFFSLEVRSWDDSLCSPLGTLWEINQQFSKGKRDPDQWTWHVLAGLSFLDLGVGKETEGEEWEEEGAGGSSLLPFDHALLLLVTTLLCEHFWPVKISSHLYDSIWDKQETGVQVDLQFDQLCLACRMIMSTGF